MDLGLDTDTNKVNIKSASATSKQHSKKLSNTEAELKKKKNVTYKKRRVVRGNQ